MSIYNLIFTDQMKKIFREEDTESELEAIIDGNLRDSYPMEEVYKVVNVFTENIVNFCLIISDIDFLFLSLKA